MLKRSTAALIVLLIASVLWWLLQAPVSYELRVINSSQQPVDQVRLFGQAVILEATVNQIGPGGEAAVVVELNDTGDLRFEVSQGYNRIDTYIERDISQLQQHQQQLEIKPNNRFIISDVQP